MSGLAKNNIMIDIETLSSTPATGMMVELAAVRFDPETFLPMDSGFYTKIAIVKTRIIDPVTLNWWARTIPDRLTEYLREAPKAPKPYTALNKFYSYCRFGDNPAIEYSDAWLWAKPTTFDVSFVFSYLEEFVTRHDNDPDNPRDPMWKFFSRRKVVDVRSFMVGKGCRNKFKSHPLPNTEPDDHNPLYDCLEQIHSIRQTLINKKLLELDSVTK